MTSRYIIHTAALALLAALPACSKFVDTPLPANKIVPQVVFANDATATSVLLGAYYSLQNVTASKDYSTDLFGDDIYYPGAGSSVQTLQENTYTDANASFQFFENYYKAIFNCNSILEEMDKQNGVSDSTARLLKGESKFLRAFSNFQLVNLYATPPLVGTTNVSVSAYVGNSTPAQVYDAMVADLKDAYNLLGDNYPSSDRVRANKAAASALLARVYLYKKDWANAEAEATRQINNTAYSLPTDLTTVFTKGSTETIWQVWSSAGYNNGQGANYIPGNTAQVFYTLRPGLLNAFEANDARRANWVRAGTGASAALYYPYKYRQRTSAGGNATEYIVQLRLAEQYLIRAEARAQLNNISGALADLNVIRARAGLPAATATSQSDLLPKIEQERRIELMVECGHRWYDLNRTGRTSYWLAPQKPTWMARDTILPYTTSLLLSNPNLKQNKGY